MMGDWLKGYTSPACKDSFRNEVFKQELEKDKSKKASQKKMKMTQGIGSFFSLTPSPPGREQLREAPALQDGRKHVHRDEKQRQGTLGVSNRQRLPDPTKPGAPSKPLLGLDLKMKRRTFTNSDKRIVCQFVQSYTSQAKALAYLQASRNIRIAQGMLSSWMKCWSRGLFDAAPTQLRLTQTGRPARGPGGNMSKTDLEFEKVLSARIALVRALGASVTNILISKLALRIRDIDAPARWKLSPIMRCQFSASWAVKFKNRNRLSSRSVQSKKKQTDATPADMDEWLEDYASTVQGMFAKFWRNRVIWCYTGSQVLKFLLNTDETPLFFEMVGTHTVDQKGRSTSQDQATVKELANEKTMITMVPTASAAGDLLPILYIVKGLTMQTLINVVSEFMTLGNVSLLKQASALGGAGAKSYIHEDSSITRTWKTASGKEKTESIPYLVLKSGSIITLAHKGWQTRATFRLQLKTIIAPYIDRARSDLMANLTVLAAHGELSTATRMHSMYLLSLLDELEALLTFDNYKAHMGDVIDSICAVLNICGKPLLPNATKFIQIIDKVVNGPIKRSLKEHHGTYLFDKVHGHLESLEVPQEIREDPEKAWKWTPSEDIKIPAPTRAQAIIWAEETLKKKQDCNLFSESLKNGFVRYGQAPTTRSFKFMSYTEQEAESVERRELVAKVKADARTVKGKKKHATALATDKLKASLLLAEVYGTYDGITAPASSINSLANTECTAPIGLSKTVTLTASLADGTSADIAMFPMSTVGSFKTAVSRELGVAPEHQLMYGTGAGAGAGTESAIEVDLDGGGELPHASTLTQCGLHDGAGVSVLLDHSRCGFACSDTKCTPLEGGWVHSPNALKCPVPGCDVLSHHLCSIEHYNAHHGHADCTGDGAYAVRCLKHCTECQREMEEEASKKY